MSVYAEPPETVKLAETAFRQAEKRYQLHFERELRKQRHGRVRGGRLTAKPTDFADVIDLNSLSTCKEISEAALQDVKSPCAQPCVVQVGTPINVNSCSSQGDSQGNSLTKAFIFRQHPGMVVFPSAISPQLQLQLMQAALEEWPDPPARTNHSKAYGTTICKLFQAAQHDLLLDSRETSEPLAQQQQLGPQQPEAQHQQTQQQPHQQQTQQQQPAQVQQTQQRNLPYNSPLMSQPPAGLWQHADRQQHLLADQAPQECQHTHQQQCVQGCLQPACHTPDGSGSPVCHHGHQNNHGATQQQHTSSVPEKLSSVGCISSSRWSAHGSGPAATTLLRKLRWVCLGPPYNWKDRAYEPHLPHRPLPPVLASLAQQYAAWAAQAQGAHAAHLAEGGVPSTPPPPLGTSRSSACGATDRQSGVHVKQQQQQYMPDAALVNYYHSGDTLNGHKDDVEVDLTQPIVTISLGCEAVFLIGGTSRDVEPTALLLRSGDVVVMGHEARACYHGVPRVLTDKPLPKELLQEAANCGGLYDTHIQHMQGCRINISMRATH